VPSKRADVLIDQRLIAGEELHPLGCIVFSVVRKFGRYDNAERCRLALQMMPKSAILELERGLLNVADLPSTIGRPEGWRIDVTTDTGVVRWTRQFDRLKSELSEHDPERIIMWHWTRYFRHLAYEIAEQTGKVWALTEWSQHASEWTLAEANRSASRVLYRASREAGFRKMTLRERHRLGLSESSGQWHRVDNITSIDGNASGVGQCSLEAAAGKQVDFNAQPGDGFYDYQERLERS